MVRYVKNILCHLFDFNARERNGAIVLVVLIACTSGIKVWLANREPDVEQADHTDLELKLTLYEWQESLASEKITENIAARLSQNDQLVTLALFDFDPNTVTREELMQMGLNQKLIQTLLNYREKGGVFRATEDLKKIYGMTAGEFNRINPYVRIGESYRRRENSGENYQFTSSSTEFYERTTTTGIETRIATLQTELNEADTSILKELRGIGSVLATRIIKYRTLLGGFAHMEQLGEVYGITDSLLTSLQDKVYADTNLVEKIDINNATTLQLSKHPYIGRYYAEGIVLYREFTGTIYSIDELTFNGLLPEDRARKLKPYLVF